MGRISATTKQIINSYYDEKIKQYKEVLKVIEKSCIESCIESFNSDTNVKKVRKLLEDINKKYKRDFSIELKRYQVNYEDDERYKKCINDIEKIKKERDRFLLMLDIFPKNSKQYQGALIKLDNIIKGE